MVGPADRGGGGRAGRVVMFTLGEPGVDELGVVDGMLVDRAFGAGASRWSWRPSTTWSGPAPTVTGLWRPRGRRPWPQIFLPKKRKKKAAGAAQHCRCPGGGRARTVLRGAAGGGAGRARGVPA